MVLPSNAFARTKENKVQRVRVPVTVGDISCKCVQKAVQTASCPAFASCRFDRRTFGWWHEPSVLLRARPGPALGRARTTRTGCALLSPPRGCLRFPPAFYFGNTQTSERLKGRRSVSASPSPARPLAAPLLGSFAPRLFLRSRFGMSR